MATKITSLTPGSVEPAPLRGRQTRAAVSQQAATTSDRIEVSEAARTLARAEQAAASSADFRFEIVSRLRDEVSAGTYTVSADALARAMVERGEQA